MERKLGVPYGHVIVDLDEYNKARELQHKGPLDISFRDDKIKALEDERTKHLEEFSKAYTELEILRAENKKLGEIKGKARELVKRLEVVHSDLKYKGVWHLAQIHGMPYNGPQYNKELEELEEALKEMP
jgi:hypothetical protein